MTDKNRRSLGDLLGSLNSGKDDDLDLARPSAPTRPASTPAPPSSLAARPLAEDDGIQLVFHEEEEKEVARPVERKGPVDLGFLKKKSEVNHSENRVVRPNSLAVAPPEEPMEVQTVDVSNEEATAHLNIDTMLSWMVDHGGSDLFISAGLPPTTKIHGLVTHLPGYGSLSDSETEKVVFNFLDEQQRKIFQDTKELDTAYDIPGKARFRVNIFRSKKSVSAVLRTIPFDIKPIEALGLPPALNNYAKLPRGLVLVTGPTGSGKSTTLAAMIDQINRTKEGHILTIEDPIEFVHQHKKCVVNQREVGTDTESFQAALKAALREAPDYILVGELRDYETISLAITMAETGHLVFGTLHTNSAPETINRIIDVFPADQQSQIRTQLSGSLQAIVCQNLVRTKDGKGRVAAVEILNTTSSIKANIRKGNITAINSDIQLGEREGMQTMDSHLIRLAQDGTISVVTAVEKAHDTSAVMRELGGQSVYDHAIEMELREQARR